MTGALEVGGWSAARPGRTLPPGKTQYPFYRGLGGPQGRSGQVENLVPSRIRSRTVQPVVSHYTDWAAGPTNLRCTGLNHSSWTFWPLKLRPLLCPETRRMNYTVMGHHILEEWICHFWLAIMYVQVSFYLNDCAAGVLLFSKPWTVILSFIHCIGLSFSCLPL